MEQREDKEIHYDGKSYSLTVESELFPFVSTKRSLKEFDQANKILQKFVSLIEKKFDGIWYIGTDYFEEELFERFMFHHGGFMEISMHGKVKCYFTEDKSEKMRKAIGYAVEKLSSHASALHIMKECKAGQKLISLADSLSIKGDKEVKNAIKSNN